MNEDGGAMRGVAVIVIVGVALGVAFNALGREDWGLPWIGVDQVASMPTLEDLAKLRRTPSVLVAKGQELLLHVLGGPVRVPAGGA